MDGSSVLREGYKTKRRRAIPASPDPTVTPRRRQGEHGCQCQFMTLLRPERELLDANHGDVQGGPTGLEVDVSTLG